MYATTEAEFTASGAADILIDRYISFWGCSVTRLSNNGLQVCSKCSCALYERLGIHKITTSAYHPCANGGVGRINHSMDLMLAMVNDNNLIGTCESYTCRARTTTPSAPLPGFPPTKYT